MTIDEYVTMQEDMVEKLLYFMVDYNHINEGKRVNMNKWLGLRTGGEWNLFLEINKTDRIVGVGEEKWCIISLE